MNKTFELALSFHDKKAKANCARQLQENIGTDKRITVTESCIFVSKLSMETAVILARNYGVPFKDSLRRVNINGEFNV